MRALSGMLCFFVCALFCNITLNSIMDFTCFSCSCSGSWSTLRCLRLSVTQVNQHYYLVLESHSSLVAGSRWERVKSKYIQMVRIPVICLQWHRTYFNAAVNMYSQIIFLCVCISTTVEVDIEQWFLKALRSLRCSHGRRKEFTTVQDNRIFSRGWHDI